VADSINLADGGKLESEYTVRTPFQIGSLTDTETVALSVEGWKVLL
jgi:hypothetical protein